jgi:hypothetical protein
MELKVTNPPPNDPQALALLEKYAPYFERIVALNFDPNTVMLTMLVMREQQKRKGNASRRYLSAADADSVLT